MKAMQLAQSPAAQAALKLVQTLQKQLVAELDRLPPAAGKTRFEAVEWLRAGGAFGGGQRFVAHDPAVFNRASVNVSQVQYENEPQRKLASASAISAIVHPRHPLAPSMHMHVSWTEMKGGSGYWRMMADLNPSIPSEAARAEFEASLREAAGSLFEQGKKQGERYFYIPALERHRGIAHFYLEDFRSADPAADERMALALGQSAIKTYGAIVSAVLEKNPPYGQKEREQQLAYHSLYFLQVLTLDRGTTSGLLVHDENDAGILGSLPSHVDRKLLQSWLPRLPQLQQILFKGLIEALPETDEPLIDDAVKLKLAAVSRAFYQKHPEAQELLARGDVVPPTQENHRS